MLRPQRARSASGASAGGALETGGAPLVNSSVSDLELPMGKLLNTNGRLGAPARRGKRRTYLQRATVRPVHPSEGRLKPGANLFRCLVFVFAVMLAATLWRECV